VSAIDGKGSSKTLPGGVLLSQRGALIFCIDTIMRSSCKKLVLPKEGVEKGGSKVSLVQVIKKTGIP
jgi:hypothetical protein